MHWLNCYKDDTLESGAFAPLITFLELGDEP